MREFNYEIIEKLAVLSRDLNGNTLELNIISYNMAMPKLDLRRWRGELMFKGVAMTEAEAVALYHALEERYGARE